jgi:hypothetical protein
MSGVCDFKWSFRARLGGLDEICDRWKCGIGCRNDPENRVGDELELNEFFGAVGNAGNDAVVELCEERKKKKHRTKLITSR